MQTNFQHRHQLGPHRSRPLLIAQFRFGIAYYNNIATQSDYGKNDSTNIGILGVNINPFTTGMAGIDIGDFSNPLTGYSASLPWARAEANIDFANTWTKIHGNHTFKFGVDIRRIRDALFRTRPSARAAFSTSPIRRTTALCTLTSDRTCGYSAVNVANYLASVPAGPVKRSGPRRKHLLPRTPRHPSFPFRRRSVESVQ